MSDPTASRAPGDPHEDSAAPRPTVVGGGTAEQSDAPTDPWAEFEPLYNEHHDRLYRIGVLLCGGRIADAEDAVAETFIRVHRAWTEGRVQDFFPYARQSLVNHVMGRGRREQTAKRYEVVTSQSVQEHRAIDEQIVDSKVVLDALDQLPSRRRTAVVLRYFEDLPYDEIANEMNVAVGTAKAQVSTGLDQLRTILAGASQ